MSGTQDAKLDAYLRRENTFLGRVANLAIDVSRDITRQPSRLIEALLYEQRQATKGQPAVELPTPAATMRRDFADMIMTSLEASGLNPKDQLRALALIDQGAVYLHQADPTTRTARTALPGSISAEWNQLGITEAQADEMISKAISYTKEQSLGPDQVADQLAAAMTRSIGPERAAGLVLLEDLAITLRRAEQSPQYMCSGYDEAGEPQDIMENLGPWEAVDRVADEIDKSPAALAIAAEWGLSKNETYGRLMTSKGVYARSFDLLPHVAKEKAQELAPVFGSAPELDLGR